MAPDGPVEELEVGADSEGSLVLKVQIVAHSEFVAYWAGHEGDGQIGAHKTPGKDVGSLVSDG
jgi:hypothetical protein